MLVVVGLALLVAETLMEYFATIHSRPQELSSTGGSAENPAASWLPQALNTDLLQQAQPRYFESSQHPNTEVQEQQRQHSSKPATYHRAEKQVKIPRLYTSQDLRHHHQQEAKSSSEFLADRFAGAPRTHHGKRFEELSPADVKSRKWFVFQPSGGFNNQRIILERALRICKLLNRICIVPPAGRHSSMYKNYNKLDGNETMAMDRILDFEFIQNYQEVFAAEITFENIIEILHTSFPTEEEWYVVEQTRSERRKAPLTLDNITALVTHPARVIYFAGPTMWQRFSRHFEYEVFPFIRYAPFFRALSLDVANSLGLGRNYVAVHSRPSDHGEKWEERRANATEAAQESYYNNEKNSQEGENKLAMSPSTAAPKIQHANGFSTKYLPSNQAIIDPGGYLLREIWLAIAEADLRHEMFQQVYIATKPTISRKVFANLTHSFQVLLSADIPEPVLERLHAVFPKPEQNRLQNDILGIVEQLICARAFIYIGFKGSSFSEYIARMRKEPKANLLVE